MSDNKEIIREKLAQEVLTKGSVRCPSCDGLILWDDAEQFNPDGSKDRYFWCSDTECELHSKDVVKVSISKGFLQTIQQNISKIGRGVIAAAFGAISMWAYSHFGTPDTDNSKQLEELKKLNEDIAKEKKDLYDKIASLEHVITDLKENPDTDTNNGDTPPPITDNSDNEALVDSLRKVITGNEADINNLKEQLGQGNLNPKQMSDLGIYYSSNPSANSNVAKKYLFDALEHPNASFSDAEYKNIIGGLMKLRPYLELNEFEKLIDQIEQHYPNNEQDVEQARVYWFYADAHDDFKKYKKYKLIALQHYLMGASRYSLHGQNAKDAIKLIDLYKLDMIDPSNFNAMLDIKSAVEQKDRPTIRKFLEYGAKESIGLW